MTKFFNKFKKAYFWPTLVIFFTFSGQTFFGGKNQALLGMDFYHQVKTNDPIPKTLLDRRTEGPTDSILLGPFWLLPRVQ